MDFDLSKFENNLTSTFDRVNAVTVARGVARERIKKRGYRCFNIGFKTEVAKHMSTHGIEKTLEKYPEVARSTAVTWLREYHMGLYNGIPPERYYSVKRKASHTESLMEKPSADEINKLREFIVKQDETIKMLVAKLK